MPEKHALSPEFMGLKVAAKVLVYRNGDEFFPPKLVLLEPKRTRDIEHFLEKIQPKFGTSAKGALRKLFTMEGNLVSKVSSLKDNGRYVVCRSEPFMKLDYGSIVGGNVGTPRFVPPQNRPTSS